MLKKIGTGFLLAFALLIMGATSQTGITQNAYACRNLADCREQAQRVTNNIATITGEADEIGVELAELQGEIEYYETRIDELLIDIRTLEIRISGVEDEIRDLYELIDETRDVIDETDLEIEELVKLISQRMRATQRFNNRSSMLSQLSTADSLNDFVSVMRQAQRAVATDAELMEELSELITANTERYENLQSNVDELAELTEYFRGLQAGIHAERLVLETYQAELLENQHRLQGRLDELYEQQQSEESRLAVIQRTQAALEASPPPPVVTQTPNATGLAHPMPGSRITSHFGPRLGRHHAGVDLVVFGNTHAPILASASGTVTLSEWHNSMGWWVIISHNINGQRVDTVYAHLRYSPPVNVGDIVSQGDVIGTKGNTGNSRGAHLHFEVHPGGFCWRCAVNPTGWVNF